ncbi:MAG: RICIN domain-containing protein [Luteolibacter sp.]|uniref:RICIN domain-containing protein n=1 Tax=Luteolibacter sp. TaxID=1962973 RepID=UPI0032652B8C
MDRDEPRQQSEVHLHFYRRRVLSITPTHATGSCLEVDAGSTANGALVQLWTYGGSNNQQRALQTPQVESRQISSVRQRATRCRTA